MNEKKYEVLYNEEVVAERMDLNTATVLIKALFETYYNEYPLTISVREMARCQGCESVGKNNA